MEPRNSFHQSGLNARQNWWLRDKRLSFFLVIICIYEQKNLFQYSFFSFESILVVFLPVSLLLSFFPILFMIFLNFSWQRIFCNFSNFHHPTDYQLFVFFLPFTSLGFPFRKSLLFLFILTFSSDDFFSLILCPQLSFLVHKLIQWSAFIEILCHKFRSNVKLFQLENLPTLNVNSSYFLPLSKNCCIAL